MELNKTCIKCKEIKAADMFLKNKSCKNGVAGICNKSKQDSTSKELRMIAGFIDSWGDQADNSIDLSLYKDKQMSLIND